MQVYDSLGKSYEATVTYTNMGNNKWSYAITLPDTLAAAAATAPVPNTTMAVTAALPVATSVTASTSFSEPATTVSTPVSPTTVPDTSANTDLTPVVAAAPVTSPAVGLVTTGPVLGITTNTYTFDVNGTVKGNTSLVLNVPTVGGVPATSTVTVTPTTADESVSAFFTDITTALANANPPVITNSNTGITVTNPTANTLVISGPASVTIGGATAVNQDVALSTSTFNFATSNGQLATVGASTGTPPTNLTIQLGTGAVISAPTFTTNEDVATYAAALQAKVGPPATSGVTINGSDTTGILTITGPTNNMTIGGNIVQSFSGTRTNFAVGSYTDPTTRNTTQAGIDGKTSLTFVGATTNATPPNNTVANFTVSPTTSGESLTDYVTDIKAALKTNNVSGVTVTGANGVLSITGPSGLSITGPTGTGSAPIFNQDTLGTIIASSVTPTSAVSTLSTVTLPPASTTPATSSTNTLSPASPTISATSSDLPAAAATVASVSNPVVTFSSVPLAGTTTNTYTFAATGTISGSMSMKITGPTGVIPATNTVTVTPTSPDESVAAYMADITAALGAAVPPVTVGAGGLSITNPTANQLVIAGPTASFSVSPTSVIKQDVAETTTNYNLITSSGTLATVAAANASTPTTLAITIGASGPYSVASTSSLSLSDYATQLQNALPANSGVTVQVNPQNPSQLQITGPSNMAINGKLVQDFNATNYGYNFGATGTVSTTTNFKITGLTPDGASATTPLPTFSGTPETVSDYITDLTNAISAANITGVSVTAGAQPAS